MSYIETQLPLFAEIQCHDPAEQKAAIAKDKELTARIEHWQKSLTAWIKEAFIYRHSRQTTGWSCAMHGISFAYSLHNAGKISQKQYARFQRFHQRLERINTRPYYNNIHVDKNGYDWLDMKKIDHEWEEHSSGLRVRRLNVKKTVLKTNWNHHLMEITDGTMSIALEFYPHPTYYGAITAALPLFDELRAQP